MTTVANWRMHNPGQRAGNCPNGTLRATVKWSLTRHTAEVWTLIGNVAPFGIMLLRGQCVRRRPPGLQPVSPGFRGRPPGGLM